MTYSLPKFNLDLYHEIKTVTGARGATIGNDYETGRALYDYQYDYLVLTSGGDIELDSYARIEFPDGEIIPLENFG